MICSLPSFTIGIWLSFFPETPKYLAKTGQNVKMLNVLAKMYSENTGNPLEKYLVSSLLSNILENLIKRFG